MTQEEQTMTRAAEAIKQSPHPIRAPWISATHWPSSRTHAAFGKDCIRIENAVTGEQKTLAIYKWLCRCYGRNGTAMEGAKGIEGGVSDTLKHFNVYGQGLCDWWGRLMGDVATAAGLVSRKIVNRGHTTVEVWYADDDGVERWHWFDPKNRAYYYSRDGKHIVSMEQLRVDPMLAADPVRVPDPYFPLWVEDREDPDAHKKWDKEARAKEVKADAETWLAGVLWSAVHSMDKHLMPGEEYRRDWRRVDGKFYKPTTLPFDSRCCQQGWHDPTNQFWKTGEIKDKGNYPYWKNYMIDCACLPNRKVKPQGNGTIVFEPVMDADCLGRGVKHPPVNLCVVQESDRPTVRVTGARQMGAVMWEIASPYVIADAVLEAEVRYTPTKHRTDLGFLISCDGGNAWHPIWSLPTQKMSHPHLGIRADGRIQAKVNFGLEPWRDGRANVYGKYSYLLRMDMLALGDPSTIELVSLKVTNWVQLNMFSLPMLKPGVNRLNLEAESIEPGWALEATVVWDDAAGKRREHRHRSTALRDSFEITTQADRQDEITMRYMTLRAVRR